RLFAQRAERPIRLDLLTMRSRDAEEQCQRGAFVRDLFHLLTGRVDGESIPGPSTRQLSRGSACTIVGSDLPPPRLASSAHPPPPSQFRKPAPRCFSACTTPTPASGTRRSRSSRK